MIEKGDILSVHDFLSLTLESGMVFGLGVLLQHGVCVSLVFFGLLRGHRKTALGGWCVFVLLLLYSFFASLSFFLRNASNDFFQITFSRVTVSFCLFNASRTTTTIRVIRVLQMSETL